MQYKLADYVLTNFLLFFSGIKICGGCSRDGREVNGIFIKRILPGGLADQDGNFFQFQMSNQVLVYCRYYVYLSV